MVDMSSTSFSKSKAFKEREESAREKLRQIVKQDLIADLSRYPAAGSFNLLNFLSLSVQLHVQPIRLPNIQRSILRSFLRSFFV